jgi:hypothetical protein
MVPKEECKAELKVEAKLEPESVLNPKRRRRSADRDIARDGLLVLREETHDKWSGAWCYWCRTPHLVPAAVFLGTLKALKK